MSLAPSLRTALAGQLTALDAALAPAQPVCTRPFSQPEPPEAPMVTVPLRVALEAQGALHREAGALRAAARRATGDSNDVAMAHDRAAAAEAALEAIRPLVRAATEENYRRHAEWRARTRG